MYDTEQEAIMDTEWGRSQYECKRVLIGKAAPPAPEAAPPAPKAAPPAPKAAFPPAERKSTRVVTNNQMIERLIA